MFWYFLFVSLMLCSGLETNPLANTFNRDAVIQKLQSALKDRCIENADEDVYNELKEAAGNYTFCLGRNARTITTQEDANRMICNEARPVGYNCTVELLKKAYRCLDPKEKYLPKFVLGGYNRTMDQQCKRVEPTIQYILPALKNLKCKPAAKGMGNMILILRCLPKLRSLKILSDPKYIFTQPNVCGDIKTIKQCVADVLKSHCINEGPLVQLITRNIDPFLVPCDAPPGK